VNGEGALKRGFRISIAGLIGIVGLAAVWFAALQSGSSYWTAAAGMFFIGALLTSVLGIACLRGPARGFCMGFALFGFIFSMEIRGELLVGELERQVVTAFTDLGNKLLPALPPEPTSPPVPVIPALASASSPALAIPPDPVPPPSSPAASSIPVAERPATLVNDGYPVPLATEQPSSALMPASLEETPSSSPRIAARGSTWLAVNHGDPTSASVPAPNSPLTPADSREAYLEAYRLRQEKLENFARIGSISACFGLGLLGGLIGWAMTARTQAARNPLASGQGGG
jgi:hypothetical protein